MRRVEVRRAKRAPTLCADLRKAARLTSRAYALQAPGGAARAVRRGGSDKNLCRTLDRQ
jgi:hypothetical protein